LKKGTRSPQRGDARAPIWFLRSWRAAKIDGPAWTVCARRLQRGNRRCLQRLAGPL